MPAGHLLRRWRGTSAQPPSSLQALGRGRLMGQHRRGVCHVRTWTVAIAPSPPSRAALPFTVLLLSRPKIVGQQREHHEIVPASLDLQVGPQDSLPDESTPFGHSLRCAVVRVGAELDAGET